MCDSRSRQCDLVKPPDRNHECLITYASAHPPSASIFSSGTLPTPTSSDALSEAAALSTSCHTYPIGPCATSVKTSALPSAVAECTNNFLETAIWAQHDIYQQPLHPGLQLYRGHLCFEIPVVIRLYIGGFAESAKPNT